MIFYLIFSCISVQYTICFYDSDSRSCPEESERYSKSEFAKFKNTDYTNSTEARLYIYCDISTDYFPIEKFPKSTLHFYGDSRKNFIKLNDLEVEKFAQRIYFTDLIVKATSNVHFNKVSFVRAPVQQIDPKDSNVEIDPLVANDIIVDPISLINVENIKSAKTELQLSQIATSTPQTFYIIGDVSLKISTLIDGSEISFYGDRIIFNKDQYYINVNTLNFHGATSISQPANTSVSLRYLMANMTLKGEVITYELGENSLLTLNECIWPTLDRARLELIPQKNASVILSAINIPLFIKNTAENLKIITNSSSLFIPSINITSKKYLTISSMLKTETILTIGTIYCLTDRNNVNLTDPNTILITQILGIEQCIFNGVGNGQYSFFQFPPVPMSIKVSNFNTIYGSHTLVVPFDLGVILESGSLSVENLNGSLEIFPNIVGNPSIEEIKSNVNVGFIIYSSRNTIEDVTVNFNKRGLRGFTEGTNIYESFVEQENGLNYIQIMQTRSIDEVNDKFCIALQESFCPADLGATFVKEGWESFADHEIAEMTFYVFNTTDIVLDFNKFDSPVVNFFGYNNATVHVTSESIEFNISYLVAKNINFDVSDDTALSFGYSADLENVHVINDKFEFVDSDTYNFITDYSSLPTYSEEPFLLYSQMAGFYDFGMSQIRLAEKSISFVFDSKVIEISSDKLIRTCYRFFFTEKSGNKEVEIVKTDNSNLTYTIEISALPKSARIKLVNFSNANYDDPIIKFVTFGSEVTINDGENPPFSFYDLIDGAVIRFNSDTVNMRHSFDASANVTLTVTQNRVNKPVNVIFNNVILPDKLEWTTKDVYVTVRNSNAVGGPSEFSQLHLDGNLTFNKGPALFASDLSAEKNAKLIIPYSFNSMPQINFTSKEPINFDSIVLNFVPPIDENVFIHRYIKFYEDSMFDILCGDFNCDSVNMVYVSEIKYFNGDLCAFEKSCIDNPDFKRCLRIRFNSEKDPEEGKDDGMSESDKKKTKTLNIIIGVVCGIISVAIIAVIVVCVRKRDSGMPESLTSKLMSESAA